MISLTASIGDRSYDVLVGEGARHRLLDVLPVGAERAAIVTQREIAVDVDPGVENRTFWIDDGEEAKCLETVEELCRDFVRWGLTRRDVVVAVGGGVVTDVGGFAAAVYHRGIPVVHVPTTLVGQIDAAIGGKCGVNLPEGKNLVGAFWQPAAVLCDTETLAELPPDEYRSGLGEMAKYHFLTGEPLMDLPLDERVARCVMIKVAIAGADERDTGLRERLNYGHTMAHALEVAGGFGLRHGEAVAIGLVFASELARVLGRIDRDRVEVHREVITAYGLPTRLPRDASPGDLMDLFGRDKKAVGRPDRDGFTFVLDGPDGVELVHGIGPIAVGAAMEAMGEQP